MMIIDSLCYPFIDPEATADLFKLNVNLLLKLLQNLHLSEQESFPDISNNVK